MHARVNRCPFGRKVVTLLRVAVRAKVGGVDDVDDGDDVDDDEVNHGGACLHIRASEAKSRARQ